MILQRSALFIVQFSHPYMTTGKTKALTRWTFVSKVMSYLFNTMSRFVNVAFLVAQMVKNLPAMQKTQVPSLSGEGALEKERATHSSILA